MLNAKNNTYEATYFLVPSYITKIPNIPWAFIQVYETIFQFWNRGRECFLSNQAIKDRTGITSTSTILKAFAFFEKRNELKRVTINNRRYLVQPEKQIKPEIHADEGVIPAIGGYSSSDRGGIPVGIHNNKKLNKENNNYIPDFANRGESDYDLHTVEVVEITEVAEVAEVAKPNKPNHVATSIEQVAIVVEPPIETATPIEVLIETSVEAPIEPAVVVESNTTTPIATPDCGSYQALVASNAAIDLVKPEKIAKSDNCDYKTNYKLDQRFMQFYEAYPRKVDPHDAYKAFKSIIGKDDVLLAHVLADIVLRKQKHTQWQDKQYIKYPAMYLRKGEYLSEIFNAEAEAQARAQRNREQLEARVRAQDLASQRQAQIIEQNNHHKRHDARALGAVRSDMPKKLPKGFIKDLIYGQSARFSGASA